MKDAFGREINYLRLSLTDQCNLRCRYCMPGEPPERPAGSLLSAAELLRICAAAAAIGISRFKITGGEPLLRPDAVEIMAAIRELPGTESITLTTNGLLLRQKLPLLAKLPLDGVNISLDALSEPLYESITGRPGAAEALEAVRSSAAAGLPTRINTVLLAENSAEWMDILALARELPVDVRFIECMPIGSVRAETAVVPAAVVLAKARSMYPDLTPSTRRGNGPAHYYESAGLRGSLGVIAANSERFCAACNRLRLTGSGKLRPCLGHPEEVDLGQALRSGASDARLRGLLAQAVHAKPAAHDFASGRNPAPYMNQIGG